MFRIVLSIFLLLFTLHADCQVVIDHLLLKKQTLDNKLLILYFQDSAFNKEITIGWQRPDGSQANKSVLVKPGKNIIDFNHLPEWSGFVNILGSNNSKLKAELKDINIQDSWQILTAPTLLNTRHINYLPIANFFSYPLAYFLISIVFMVALICILVKINWRVAIFFGLIGSSVILGSTQVKDEISFINNSPIKYPFNTLDPFLKHIKPMIYGKKWSLKPLGGAYDSYVKYHLAETSFIPLKFSDSNTLLITNQPKNRRILHHQNGFYLVQ